MTFSQLFSERQLLTLSTLATLVVEAQRERVSIDALTAGLRDDRHRLETGGAGAYAYADAVSIYLGLGVSKAQRLITPRFPMGSRADQARSRVRPPGVTYGMGLRGNKSVC